MLNPMQRILAKLIPVPYLPQTRVTTADVVIAGLLGSLAAAYSFYCFGMLDAAIYLEKNTDTWFDADPDRRFAAIHDPANSRLGRTSVHPIYVLLFAPVMKALAAFGLGPVDAARSAVAGSACLSTAFLCLALRGLGLPRPIAALFAGVFIASATFVHWFAIVETYAFSAVMMSFMLFVLTSADTKRWWLWLLASAATLSITVTNWTLGLTSLFFRLDFRRAVALSAAAFVIVSALTVAQKLSYPHSRMFFMPSSVLYEWKALLINPSVLQLRAWTPFSNLWSLAVSSAVTPAPHIGTKIKDATQRFVSNQNSPLATHIVPGWAALISWFVLLAAAIRGGYSNLERRSVFTAVGLFLLGQMALHSIYGEATFIFSGNFFSSLVLFVAFGWFSPWRIPAAVAALAFVVFGGWSNFVQLNAAASMLQSILLERAAMN